MLSGKINQHPEDPVVGDQGSMNSAAAKALMPYQWRLMNIFISYSREDAAIAHLLCNILQNRGINVLIDTYLSEGEESRRQICEYIDQAEVVVPLITNSATSSAWVNQEIGFALGKGKKIIPLALKAEHNPEGMITGLQKFSLFDWSNPQSSIERFIALLAGDNTGIGLDLVVRGKVERTKLLVTKLREALNSEKPLTIYHQAGFSIFAFSHRNDYRTEHHTDEYMNALEEEHNLLNSLVHRKNTDFRMILWPERPYDPAYLGRRYRTLLEWLEEAKSKFPNIRVIVARYNGPNIVLVDNHFLFESRSDSKPGYDLGLCVTSQDRIKEAKQQFLARWEVLQEDGKNPITEFERLLKQINQP